MNPYQQLMLQAAAQGAEPVPVGVKAFNTDVDVAQNIGHDKLSKKKYNPYGLINGPEALPQEPTDPRQNFRREMLKDATQ
jgi:hypothetical protein